MNALVCCLVFSCGQTFEMQGPPSPEPDSSIMIAAFNGRFNTATAITALLRAHRIDPSHPIANEGLALIRREIAYPIDPALAAALQPESEWYPGWFFYPFFSIFGYLAWCVACFAIARWYRYGRRAWLYVAGALVPFALIPAFNEIVRNSRDAREKSMPSVVVARNTDFRLGNGSDYPLLTPVPRGAECRFLAYRSGWCQVEFASGLTGWIPRGDLVGVIPP
jgi:hypothetical protein